MSQPAESPVYKFFVDAKPYETTHQYRSGQEIKHQAGIADDYQLFEEREGDEPDKPVRNDETVDLAGKEKALLRGSTCHVWRVMDFDEQYSLLRQHTERAGSVLEIQPLPSGARVVTVRNVGLPAGWNQAAVTVAFYVPPGYPSANPDCFWAEPHLKLANGQEPQASNVSNPMPEVGPRGTWFSWHIQGWRPNQSTLVTFFNSIRSRLDPAR